VGITPGLAPQLFAIFGQSLLQIDSGVAGVPLQLAAHGLQQTAIGGGGATA
jgi:hypothetical protein